MKFYLVFNGETLGEMCSVEGIKKEGKVYGRIWHTSIAKNFNKAFPKNPVH